MNHAELKAKALSDPETLATYNELEAEFSLLKQMLRARQKAGLSQAQVAEKWAPKRQLLRAWSLH